LNPDRKTEATGRAGSGKGRTSGKGVAEELSRAQTHGTKQATPRGEAGGVNEAKAKKKVKHDCSLSAVTKTGGR